MSTFRRILVPVDGSPQGTRGVREAVRLAKDHRAKLRLLHVVDESAAVGAVDAGIDLAVVLDGLARRGHKLLENARRAAQRQGVSAEAVMRESAAAPAAAILREARAWRADVIVMGTHGRRGLRRLVLGSDAEQVLRRTTVPVLLIRSPR